MDILSPLGTGDTMPSMQAKSEPLAPPQVAARRSNMTEESSPIPENPAIARYYSEWQRVYKKEKAKGQHWVLAVNSAGQAYRSVMPPLTGKENIRDFVACVAHGMLIGATRERTEPSSSMPPRSRSPRSATNPRQRKPLPLDPPLPPYLFF
jgi:hypothetical protein